MQDFFATEQQQLDCLTKVFTREAINEFSNSLISKKDPFSIMILDIDNFKYVNDTYGHSAGDFVLKEIVQRTQSAIKGIGEIGRYGGDEFLIVFPNIINYDAVWTTCRTITQAISKTPFALPENLVLAEENFANKNQREIFITVTIGVARFPEDADSYEQIMETADKALYRGKIKGRNCFIIYLPEKHKNIVLKKDSENILSSMNLHNKVFQILTQKKNLEENISELLIFLSSYYMYDNICIQRNGKLDFQKIHKLSKFSDFAPIEPELIVREMAGTNDFFYLNQRDYLLKSNHVDLHDELENQHVSSTFFCKICYQDCEFGYLRADSCHTRIWQYDDMDILITSAKLIGVLMGLSEIHERILLKS